MKMEYPYPELNRELLVKVVDHALSAENWDQGVWYEETDQTSCGTAMCIAGFTAIDFAGWTPVKGSWGRQADMCEKDGKVRSIDSVAKDALGLTDREASILFSPGQDEDAMLRNISERILGGVYRPGYQVED